MSETRHHYDRARAALTTAHDACFKHPDRDPLGMSSGPFSGVNEALGIVAKLEEDQGRLRFCLDQCTKLLETLTDPNQQHVSVLHIYAQAIEASRRARRVLAETSA